MDLLDRANSMSWYHAIELAPGRVTPGVFDLRDQVHHYGLPDRLDGKRVLDVGSLNGFWAFELERRGAAEVIALDVDDEADLDWPPRRRNEIGAPREVDGLRLAAGAEGFELAKEILGAKAERVTRTIYAAYPEDLGTFDLIFCGSVIMHLRDQMLALERIAALLRPGGVFVSAEEYDLATSLLPVPVARFRGDRPSAPVFWLPSARTWKRMLWTAGFDRVERHGFFKLYARAGWTVRHVVHHAHLA